MKNYIYPSTPVSAPGNQYRQGDGSGQNGELNGWQSEEVSNFKIAVSAACKPHGCGRTPICRRRPLSLSGEPPTVTEAALNQNLSLVARLDPPLKINCLRWGSGYA